MSPALTAKAQTLLRQYIDNATNSEKGSIPGAVVHIVDAQNSQLFSHGASRSHPANAQSISIIHSLSKLVGAIAFLQLVERESVSLDDASVISTYLPELANQRVLTGYTEGDNGKKQWHFEDRKSDITPRMLLNHTYGGGHSYFNSLLYTYLQDEGLWEEKNETADVFGAIVASPLLWQPGTKTNYGQGLDWIAVLIERLTRISLVEYLQKNIFDPLGLSTIGFEPMFGGQVLIEPKNKGKFWPRIMKVENSFVDIDPKEPTGHVRDDAWPKGSHHVSPLGTGLVSSAEHYAKLLTLLLPRNAGLDGKTGARLLSTDLIKQITSPQLPEDIRNNSRIIPISGASPIVIPANLKAEHMDPNGSYGLACGIQGTTRVLKGGKAGRSGGSVYWYGAANTEYWVDLEKGLVVFLNGNYLPWNDEAWTVFVADVESMIYEGLD